MDSTNLEFPGPTRAGQLLQRPLVRFGLNLLVWTLVGLFFTSQVLFNSIYMEKRMPTGNVFFMQMSVCYLWALATPLVLWLARHFRIDRDKWLRRTLLHVGIGTLLVGSMSAIHYVLFITYFGRLEYLTPLRTLQYVLYNLDRQVSIYCIIVLSSNALHY